MRARGKGAKTSKREQQLVFAAIALFMTCAVLLPILLAFLSSRADLYAVKPQPVRPGIVTVDWKSLGALISGPVNPAVARPDWFGPEVEIAGYMIPVAPSPARQKVAHFLLVPDPGDWLNPPHLHAAEVIEVRLKDGETTRLVERTALVVCGRLSFGSLSANPRAMLFLTDATVDWLARAGSSTALKEFHSARTKAGKAAGRERPARTRGFAPPSGARSGKSRRAL